MGHFWLFLRLKINICLKKLLCSIFTIRNWAAPIVSQIFKSVRVSEAILGVRSINIINLGHYIGGNNRLYNAKHIIYDSLIKYTAKYAGHVCLGVVLTVRFSTDDNRLILRFNGQFQDFQNCWKRPDWTKVLEYMVAVRPLG